LATVSEASRPRNNKRHPYIGDKISANQFRAILERLSTPKAVPQNLVCKSFT